MNYFGKRLREPSTWRGFGLLLTALGISVSPEMLEHIVMAGVGFSGLIGVLSGDHGK